MKINHSIKFFAILCIILTVSLFAIRTSSAQTSICEPNTYYVDATNGLDTNDGTCSDKAWKTIAKVNSSSFSPGSTIKFKKGETWHEQLTIPSSGTAGNPITFTSYGTGTKPTIDRDNTGTYGIYSSGKSYITIDGFIIKKLGKGYAYAIYFTGGSYAVVSNNDISEVYYASNPYPNIGIDIHDWEHQYGVGILLSKVNGALISGNTIRDCGSSAISYSTGDNVNLFNLGEISNNEITNINVGIRIASGNTSGIAIQNVKVHNNYIHDFNNYYYCSAWHRDAIHVWSTSGLSATSIEDIEIYDNYFEDTVNHVAGSTAWIYIEYNCKNFKIHHNVLTQGASINAIRFKGLSGQNPYTAGGHEVYNNTIWSILDANNGTGIYSEWTIGNTFKNNIFYVQKFAYTSSGETPTTGFESDYNIMIDFDGDDIATYNAAFKNFAELQSAGLETHSINANPLFVNENNPLGPDGIPFTADDGLKLSAGSPAIGSGTNGQDIGAYDYIPPPDTISPSAPSGLSVN